ncbi:hypothetical protein BJ138DRAFT_1164130 [Hygrophoropsis aurantiaca]|uniref:Uncharacterized protein n=1 Tax=Hygrophoropsis aurantiaca TaxID=72124 RepID=A0ACB7ZXK0_9AGAM|nr:hypothetical protein BJ138DRAFT_1164130 [Hygrophoropsis aurantiaca]
MENPPSRSPTITPPHSDEVNTQRLVNLIIEAILSISSVLHYDANTRNMVEWLWPADDENAKIPPSQFNSYRKNHVFKFPCCICADNDGQYMESAVYPWWDETIQKTFWTARCAMDNCGYEVRIDQYFKQTSQVTFIYPQKANTRRPPPVQMIWTRREQRILMDRLDSFPSNGISAKEFLRLFKACRRCKRVGTRVAMRFHACQV